jgi:phosphonate transport system substrate-binding protein
MTRLSLTFYMGSVLIPVAKELAATLTERMETAVAFDEDASDAERRAALDEAQPGVVWLCGLETVVRQDDGRLPASIVGAPIFPGHTSPVYDSVIVGTGRWDGEGLDDLADGAALAINQSGSWSGHHALRAHLARRGLGELRFGPVIETGSHEASIDALLRGDADVAAIDETVWVARLARDPSAGTLRVIDRTQPQPAPPFSIVHGLDAGLEAALRDALLTADVPGLEGIAPASDADYAVFRDNLAVSRSISWPSP